jgi:hypothetical protein
MVKASTDIALRAELEDLIIDLYELHSVALEVQFNDVDLCQYNYWLHNTIGYTILAQEVVGTRRERSPINQEEYFTKSELLELTDRVLVNFNKTLMAYENETDTEFKEILNIIRLCLIKTKSHAN